MTRRISFVAAFAALCVLPLVGGCTKTEEAPADAASPAASGSPAPAGATSGTATEVQDGVEKSPMPGGGPGGGK